MNSRSFTPAEHPLLTFTIRLQDLSGSECPRDFTLVYNQSVSGQRCHGDTWLLTKYIKSTYYPHIENHFYAKV